MVEPTGYTALDLIGFTDRGDYDPSAYYVKNDLVHDDGDNIWRVLIDDTHGVTPAEGLNYTIFIRNQADAAKQIIAPVESGTTVSQNYAIGDIFIKDDTLYKAVTALVSGTAWTSYTTPTNYKSAGTVSSQIQTLNTALATQALYFTSVACSATTGNFLTKSDANITADHVVAECTFANPSLITSDVTWTTASGSVTLNGTCASATTANLVLVKKGN